MQKNHMFVLSLAGIALGLLLEVFLLPSWQVTAPPPPGPQSLTEVAELAERQGLYARSDRRDGKIMNRLLVSDRPLSFEQTTGLRINEPRHPRWAGVAAVSFPGKFYRGNDDPEFSVYWGETLVYGDREIIRRLTGRQLRDEPGA